MATAEELRTEFEQYMDEKGVKYRVASESDNIVSVSFETECGDVNFLIDFYERGNLANSVRLVCGYAAKIKPGCESQAIMACNTANRSRRWTRFYLHEEDTIRADWDARIYPGSVGSECVDVMMLMLRGVKEFRANNKEILASGEPREEAKPKLEDLSPEDLEKVLALLKALAGDRR